MIVIDQTEAIRWHRRYETARNLAVVFVVLALAGWLVAAWMAGGIL